MNELKPRQEYLSFLIAVLATVYERRAHYGYSQTYYHVRAESQATYLVR